MVAITSLILTAFKSAHQGLEPNQTAERQRIRSSLALLRRQGVPSGGNRKRWKPCRGSMLSSRILRPAVTAVPKGRQGSRRKRLSEGLSFVKCRTFGCCSSQVIFSMTSLCSLFDSNSSCMAGSRWSPTLRVDNKICVREARSSPVVGDTSAKGGVTSF